MKEVKFEEFGDPTNPYSILGVEEGVEEDREEYKKDIRRAYEEAGVGISLTKKLNAELKKAIEEKNAEKAREIFTQLAEVKLRQAEVKIPFEAEYQRTRQANLWARLARKALLFSNNIKVPRFYKPRTG